MNLLVKIFLFVFWLRIFYFIKKGKEDVEENLLFMEKGDKELSLSIKLLKILRFLKLEDILLGKYMLL